MLMDRVFISIGSNLGDRISNCRKAVNEMAKFCNDVKVSSLYETEPVDKEDQPNFINAAAQIRTDLSPHQLLEKLNLIEEQLSRVRHEKWGPRTIDLDIIFYGNLILNDDDLIIPHPRAHLRQFVLEPICEIDPDFIYTGLDFSVLEALKKIEHKYIVTKLEESFTISQH